MNIGQLYELHLGWAGRGLGEKLKDMLEEKMEADRFRDLISRIYKKDEVDAWLKKASDKQIMELSKKMKTGVRFSTPVFDGAATKLILKKC
jgi:DNA-directed RNA polymerase subunit beta